MSRATALLALIASTLVAAPSVSEACSRRHQPMFELFERAATVAEVVVAKVPAGTRSRLGAGPVTMRVKRVLKGDKKRASLVTQETNTSCHIGFRAGTPAIVFLDKDGETLGGGEGYFEEVGRWTKAVDAWAAATDDAARTAILVDQIETGDRAVANDAGFYLANQPALIAKVDAATRDRLLALAKTARPDTRLPLLVVRLRGKDAPDPSVQAVLAETAFERVTDPNVLADAIVAGKGEHDPKRIAAFERCERVHGRALYPLTSYISGVADTFWPTLAEACRTGTPHD